MIVRQTKLIDQNDVFNESDEEFDKELILCEKGKGLLTEEPIYPEDEDDDLIIEEFDE